jgi:hypothetical protein
MTIQDAPLAGRRVAGFRVLRSLARDAEAEVLLGFREGEQPSTVALKTAEATPARWAATVEVLEALERARGEHVVEVFDVHCTDEVLCVVFERVPNGSLAELLVLRGRLDAGEVVTIIAPLAATLERMHAAGVGHGAVDARTVLFRADGAPVLIGFGSSAVFPPGSPEVVLEREGTVCADRRALRALACLLLSRVSGARARASHALVTQLESCPEPFVLDLLGRRLFEVAAAVPVRFTVHDDDAASGEPTRAVPIGPPVEVGEGVMPSRQGWTAILVRLIPEAWAQRVLDSVAGSPLAPVLAAAARAWRRWSPGRRRLVLAVAVVVVVLGGSLSLIPTAPSASADTAGRPSTAPTASMEPSVAASSERSRAVEGDDPLAAAVVLVAGRERCLRSLSQLCLDDVDQPESGALRDDRQAIRAAQQGGELPDPLMAEGTVPAPELVERLGDSALVRLREAASGTSTAAPNPPAPQREPASLLLVKGEAGWRIRDVIAAPTNVSAGSN